MSKNKTIRLTGLVFALAAHSLVLTAAGFVDFNGDGKSDLVFQHDDGRVEIWLMNGANLVQRLPMSFGQPLHNAWHVVSVGDYNGDNKPDILFQNTDPSCLRIWYLNGTSVYNDRVNMTGVSSPIVGGIQMLGSQGLATTLIGSDNYLFVLSSYVSCDGAYPEIIADSRSYICPNPGGWSIQASASDGEESGVIFWQHVDDGYLSKWIVRPFTTDFYQWPNDGYFVCSDYPGPVMLDDYSPLSPSQALGLKIGALGDFNNDGQIDLVFQNQSNGALSMWLMGGNGGYTLQSSPTMNPQNPGVGWHLVGPK